MDEKERRRQLANDFIEFLQSQGITLVDGETGEPIKDIKEKK